ncbi:hypothetical protein BT69DRAFT_24703 [Atractiella rhizophila]|nr:hypothetical protein BT69DRAFT_24703 [Atractiella rhizophila]
MMNVDEQDHDASRKPTYLELAASKGHSTFGEATEVAVQMKARHCLLTHFSARYPKLPPLSPPSASSSSDEPKFAVAFDLMSIRMGNWWKLAHFRASMATLFCELEPDEVEVVSVEDAGGKEPPIPADEKRKTLPPSQKQKPAKKKKLQTKEHCLDLSNWNLVTCTFIAAPHRHSKCKIRHNSMRILTTFHPCHGCTGRLLSLKVSLEL